MAFIGVRRVGCTPAQPPRQQALPPGVEDQPGLRVGRRDQHAEGGGHASDVGERGEGRGDVPGHGDERDGGGGQLGPVVPEPGHGGEGEQQVADHHQRDGQEHRAGHVAPRVTGLLSQRGRVFPADEQVDGQREARGQPGEAVGEVTLLLY